MTLSVSLEELAVRFGCELRGDPALVIERVATLSGAAPGSIAFLANPRYRRELAGTAASAVILCAADAGHCPVACLVVSNPYATYARIAQWLYPRQAPPPGIHPTAIVDPTASIDASAHVGPGVVIAAGVQVGPRAEVGPGCVLLEGASVGHDTRLVARVTLCDGVNLGARCLLQPGCVIGADGFGHAPDTDGYVKVPQVGSVRIGDDVEIGACSTVDRGAIEDTVIEDGVRIDNQVQVGHNVRIGAHTVVAGCAGISGSTRIGRRCMIGGMAGIAGHLEIADDVMIGGKALVSASIRKPGMYLSALPADEARRFRRNAARFQRLDESMRRGDVRRSTGEEEGGDDD